MAGYGTVPSGMGEGMGMGDAAVDSGGYGVIPSEDSFKSGNAPVNASGYGSIPAGLAANMGSPAAPPGRGGGRGGVGFIGRAAPSGYGAVPVAGRGSPPPGVGGRGGGYGRGGSPSGSPGRMRAAPSPNRLPPPSASRLAKQAAVARRPGGSAPGSPALPPGRPGRGPPRTKSPSPLSPRSGGGGSPTSAQWQASPRLPPRGRGGAPSANSGRQAPDSPRAASHRTMRAAGAGSPSRAAVAASLANVLTSPRGAPSPVPGRRRPVAGRGAAPVASSGYGTIPGQASPSLAPRGPPTPTPATGNMYNSIPGDDGPAAGNTYGVLPGESDPFSAPPTSGPVASSGYGVVPSGGPDESFAAPVSSSGYGTVPSMDSFGGGGGGGGNAYGVAPSEDDATSLKPFVGQLPRSCPVRNWAGLRTWLTGRAKVATDVFALLTQLEGRVFGDVHEFRSALVCWLFRPDVLAEPDDRLNWLVPLLRQATDVQPMLFPGFNTDEIVPLIQPGSDGWLLRFSALKNNTANWTGQAHVFTFITRRGPDVLNYRLLVQERPPEPLCFLVSPMKPEIPCPFPTQPFQSLDEMIQQFSQDFESLCMTQRY